LGGRSTAAGPARRLAAGPRRAAVAVRAEAEGARRRGGSVSGKATKATTSAKTASVGGRSIEELRREMAQLQEQIHHAHLEAHVQGQRVEDALDDLRGLGERSRELEASLFDPAPSTSAASATEQEQAVQRAASTSSVAPGPAEAQQQRLSLKTKDLKSDLTCPTELKEFWHPVEFSKTLTSDKPSTFDVFSMDLVLTRCAETGAVRCVHLAKEGEKEIPTSEKDGFVWVWLGAGPAPAPDADVAQGGIPGFTTPPNAFHEDKPFTIHAELLIDVEVEHGLLLENLLDLAHAPFTHTATFAKGWSIPDLVKFNTSKLLGGNWEPYPIDMSFEPPYMVLSTIGLMQPGKLEEGARAAACQNHLHQLHVCLPSSKGTRLLYRMSLDFMNFMLYVPFAKKVWETMAGQVLGEDLRLVQGQEDRLKRGGDTWANPVPYDKLAVRYRKWRNALGDKEKRKAAEAALRTTMSAGDMLSPDLDEARDTTANSANASNQ